VTGLPALLPLHDLDEAAELQAAVAFAHETDESEANTAVRKALRRARIYAVGMPSGKVENDAKQQSDLVYFALDDPKTGKNGVWLPVFTASGPMREALRLNPDWQGYSVLELEGAALMAAVADDALIVIDPWSSREHQLPSRDETDLTSESPSSESSDAAGRERPAEG
jgi:hypothetical protein